MPRGSSSARRRMVNQDGNPVRLDKKHPVDRKVKVITRRNEHREIIPEPDNFDCFRRTLKNYFVSNTVVVADLTVCDIDLQRIAEREPAAVFHRETFAAFRMNLRSPRSTCLVYPQGQVVCMASKSTTQSLFACWKYVWLLNSFGVKCEIRRFRCDNVVSTVLSFPLDLPKLARKWNHAVTYDPSNFSGARLKCRLLGIDTDIMVTFFESGKMNFTGALTPDETVALLEHLYWRILVKVRVRGDQPDKKKKKKAQTEANALDDDDQSEAESESSNSASDDEDEAADSDADSDFDNDEEEEKIDPRARAAAERLNSAAKPRQGTRPDYSDGLMTAVNALTDYIHFPDGDKSTGPRLRGGIAGIDKILDPLGRKKQF